jgi:hypothetical protein
VRGRPGALERGVRGQAHDDRSVRGQFREFEGLLEAADDDPSHDFGVRWNQPISGGRVLVGEEVQILLDISAVRADH